MEASPNRSFPFRDWVLGCLFLAAGALMLRPAVPWSALPVAAAIALGLGALRGVPVKLWDTHFGIVTHVFSRWRHIPYADVASVRLSGVPVTSTPTLWAPGLHVRIELKSGETIAVRAAHGPWLTRVHQRRLRELGEELERAVAKNRAGPREVNRDLQGSGVGVQ
jgi:hypothetical protein